MLDACVVAHVSLPVCHENATPVYADGLTLC
jgi:hypothetical protein